MEFIKKLIMNPIDTIKAAFSDDLTPEEEKKQQIKEAEETVRIQKNRVSNNRRAVKMKSFGETEEESAEQLKEYEQSQVVLEEKRATLAALKAGPMQELPKPQGVGEEGKQLAQTTQEVATKKEEQNKGQAAPVVVQAGNGDTTTINNGTTLLGPSLRSIPDPNWMYDE